MEGDVDGVWDRPSGNGEDAQKWDAWKAQSGISRTEAKRRYISTLIETMHKYASQAPDARELVSELEFVWDQIKSNVPSSSSSSPLQTLGGASIPGLQNPPPYPTLASSQASLAKPPASPSPPPARGKAPLRVMSPVSQEHGHDYEEDEEDDDDAAADNADREEFVDAPDSQYTGPDPPFSPERESSRHSDSGDGSGGGGGKDNRGAAGAGTTGPPARPARPGRARSERDPEAGHPRWRRRVESALVQLTAEVAALREQLEARSLWRERRRSSVWSWFVGLVWGAFKHITIDMILLGVVLLWMRRKKDRRLEGAVRVLLGDAVAQVQKGVGEVKMGKLPSMPNLKIPRLNGRKGSGS
ncbi:MAG: hypothetical protein M1822_009999 [Bathelium mastoideum]|nr:MAG: hypothetical protein M1822_009999 [Bathelium mastoideum]